MWLIALFAVQSQQPTILDPGPLTWVSGCEPLATLASVALPYGPAAEGHCSWIVFFLVWTYFPHDEHIHSLLPCSSCT